MSESMKAAVWYGEPKLVVQQWEKPDIRDDEVLVRVAFAGICASDVHIINNGLPRDAVTPPRIIGHECSGIVDKIGKNVASVKLKDKVSGNPVGSCGACYYCKNKMEHLCERPYSIIRGPGQGCFAEYVVFKEKQITIIPDDVSLKHGTLMEPVSIAVHCIEQANVQIGDTCVIIGAGPIGLLLVSMVRARGGGKIIVSDPNEMRREYAVKAGADITVDPSSQDLYRIVRDNTQDKGADICIEAVGSPALIEKCPKLVRYGGTVLLVGWPPKEAKVLFEPFMIYRYEIQIKGSQYSPYCFDKTARIMSRLDLDLLIKDIYVLDDINEAFKMQQSGGSLKILLKISDDY